MGEGGGMVVHVGIGELWVVADVLALEQKGGRGWGYGCACPNWVAEALHGRGWGYGHACQDRGAMAEALKDCAL